MSMARLWRDQGKRNEARDLLAPVYGWFTEGFDTRDLKETKALLDELAAFRRPPITDWLEKLGLGQYAQQLVEKLQGFSPFSILPNAEQHNFMELCLSALGHGR